MIYGDTQAAIEALVLVNRELVAAIRWLIDPTHPRQMRGVETHLETALETIREVEANLKAGRTPAAMDAEAAALARLDDDGAPHPTPPIPTDAGPDHYAGIFTSDTKEHTP